MASMGGLARPDERLEERLGERWWDWWWWEEGGREVDGNEKKEEREDWRFEVDDIRMVREEV